MNEEVKILKGQLIAQAIIILTGIIAIISTYEALLKEEHKPLPFDERTIDTLSLVNRVLILLLLLYFLYTSYENVVIAKEKGKDQHPFNLQLIASILSLIAGGIVLYVSIIQQNNANTNVTVENPEL